jgi:quinol monooxygenase YgiN
MSVCAAKLRGVLPAPVVGGHVASRAHAVRLHWGAFKARSQSIMIHVIANISVKPGSRDEFLRVFLGNVPNVLAEDGCIRYEPCTDVDTGIPAQGGVRSDIVTIVECWESLDHLRAHLAAPHMQTYREKVKDLVGGVTLQVLEPVVGK